MSPLRNVYVDEKKVGRSGTSRGWNKKASFMFTLWSLGPQEGLKRKPLLYSCVVLHNNWRGPGNQLVSEQVIKSFYKCRFLIVMSSRHPLDLFGMLVREVPGRDPRPPLSCLEGHRWWTSSISGQIERSKFPQHPRQMSWEYNCLQLGGFQISKLVICKKNFKPMICKRKFRRCK